MKTKKFFFALPLILIFLVSAFLFTACNESDKEIFVNSLTELNNAIKTSDSDHVIKLNNDIATEKDGNTILPVLIYPENKDYDVTIDLNGFNIYTYVRVTCKQNDVETDNEINLTIKNSKNSGGLIGFENDEYYYGMIVLTNNKANISLENVTFKAQYAGLYTNGSYQGETTISGKNSRFISTHSTTITDPKDGGVGAYCASKNFTYNFDNCYFEGYTAYHTKHGTTTLKNCVLNATGTVAYQPAFYGNGGSATGSALMIESVSNYNDPLAQEKQLKVIVDGGRYTSLANYAIEEASTAPAGSEEVCYAEILIKNNPTLDGEGEKTYTSENDLI